MPDGQIIQYEHDGAFLQEQQVRSIVGDWTGVDKVVYSERL